MHARATNAQGPTHRPAHPSPTPEPPTERSPASEEPATRPLEPTREARGAHVYQNVVFPHLEPSGATLPALAAVSERTETHTASTDTQRCILIVDDNLLVRHTIRRMLAGQGYSIVDAPDLERGGHACAALDVQVLILDLILPNREVTSNFLDARRRFPNARVVAVTGGGRTGPKSLLEVARELGAFAAIQKPFRREALLSVLRAPESH